MSESTETSSKASGHKLPKQNEEEDIYQFNKPPAKITTQSDFSWVRNAMALIFFASLALMMVFHHQNTGWNVNTRLALVVAVVEEGTFSIDGLHDEGGMFPTNDKAYYEGRFYSDKTFGVSLLATPFYFLLFLLGKVFSFSPSIQTINFWLTLFAVKIPAAWSLSVLWYLMVRLGAAPRRALIATMGCFTGSLWLGFATVFMPYATGIAACLTAFWLVLYPSKSRLTIPNSIAIGLLLGFALICDLIFGIVVVMIAFMYLARLADQGSFIGVRAFADMSGDRTNGKGCLKLLGVTAIAGAIFPLLFAFYCKSIFGSFSIPYEYEYLAEFREAMAQGFMGIGIPKLTAAYYLTIHPFRGLFFWSPWILLALAGAYFGIRSTGRRRIIGWYTVIGFVGYLLFNAGYYMWWGGWAMGPRLMLPMFVFLPLSLAELCRRSNTRQSPRHKGWEFALYAALFWSALSCLPVSFMEPQTATNVQQITIESATISSGIPVAQFAEWKFFWKLMIETVTFNSDYNISRGWTFILAFFLATALTIMNWRKLPEKYIAFEKLEVPFINFDGNAAPLPRPGP